MPIHMNDCSRVHPCVASVAMVRTMGTYIRIYRTSLSVYNMFHLMITLTASHVASMNDTTNDTMCNDNKYSMGATWRTTYVHHMIFRGCNVHKIHYVAFYGAFTPSHVCLYTPSILNTI